MDLHENKDINLALLIDVDNVSARYIERILSELSNYGKITIRRMYGDWSQSRLKHWLDVSSRYSLTPVMQTNATPGKNSSDIGLIIDAMDILFGGDVEGFCIVSSDSDFYRLATRIREAGKLVIGMGEKKTPESFRASCERFIFLDVLEDSNDNELSDEDEDELPIDGDAPPRDSADIDESNNLSVSSLDSSSDPNNQSSGIVSKSALEKAIINMINDNATAGHPTGLGEIGSRLVKIYPDFDVRNYNYSKLSAFVNDFQSLNIYTENNKTWVGLKVSTLKDIESQIAKIYQKNGVIVLNIGFLRNELQKVNPSLAATVRQSGVTKFSTFLKNKITCTSVVNQTDAKYTGSDAATIVKSSSKKVTSAVATKKNATQKSREKMNATPAKAKAAQTTNTAGKKSLKKEK